MKLLNKVLLTLGTLMWASLGAVEAAESPMFTSWYTTNSGLYARVYKTTSAKTSGTTSTTWTDQALPVYSDVHVVSYSTSWVYVQYSGLASHVMGPWLNPQGGQFQFWPTNRHGLHRFPRTQVVQSGTKDSTSGGYSGLFVNGVAIFNSLDGQAWDGSQIQGQAPHTQSTYYWHRNAPVAEAFNFDEALGHQPPSGVYHTHQNPLGLRYQLGDHVSYDSATKAYSESAAAVTSHSPIIGWAHDGYPVYGPYGYATAGDSGSGVRRMVSGYVKRDGSNGTDMVSTNQSTIPAWYARYRVAHFGGGYSTNAGVARPAVNGTYPLGTFAQDWTYLADVGKTQSVDFDLDEYNGRFCVTPEYPAGTYAYFTTIDAAGEATYPYLLAFEFYGDAKGGSVNNISETVVNYYVGGPDKALVLDSPSVNNDNNTVTLTWSSVEGGTYQVESSPNQSTWTTQSASVSSGGSATQSSYVGALGTAFARVTRTALATYDSATTGTYTSIQTDTEGYTVSSLSITTHPQSQTVNAGTDVTFTVAASGAGPFTYLWYKGNDAIPSATESTYTLEDVTATSAGTYKVVVTGSAGSLPSNEATLTVIVPPAIGQDPQSQTVGEGTDVTFTVTASGTAPLYYQWKKGAAIIDGAITSSYTVNDVTSLDEGTYSVVVTNAAGTATSGGAILTVTAPVNTPPTITQEPVAQTVTEGGSVTLTVQANGTGPLSYQWKLNSSSVAGATGSSYTINPVYATNAGTYHVVVTNLYGTDTSVEVSLTVNPAGSDDSVILTEWLTKLTGRYARIYETKAAETAGTTVTTWNRGAGVQSLPVYSGVQEISHSEDWVYIRTTGLGFHTMGPWYLDAQKTQLFPNYPANSKTYWRFPRNPAAATTPTLTSLGAIGYFVDGVAMFDGQDGYYWNGSSEVQGGSGGLWNRDAFPEEGVSFDPANAHQEQTGMYHYHANPLALRYLMEDNVAYNSGTKAYAESGSAPTKHSPIIGWVRDGYPIYGPYGYSDALDSGSTVRRMTTGYALRNGQNNTVNLATTGRVTLPAWAARARSRSATLAANEYGPGVAGVYVIGRYHEDYEYLGDVGKVQGTDFDLDEHNGRFCKTPEFPNGTYAYFMTINSSGTPVYPYNIGRVFYGNPSGGSVTALSETVVTNWMGGANREISVFKPAIEEGILSLTWTAVEGGTYVVENSYDLSSWTDFEETSFEGTPSGEVLWGTDIEIGPDNLFFRVKRTGLATYDTSTAAGGGTGGGGTGSGGITSVSPATAAASSTVTVTITLDVNATPALPPTMAVPSSVTIGGVSGTSIQRTSTNTVTASFTFGATASTNTVTVTFTNPMDSSTVSYTLTDGFIVQTAGGGGGGGVVTFSFTFPTAPPLPPQDAIQVAAVGTVTATVTSYTQATGAVTLQFNNSTLAVGNHSATLKFTPPGGSQQTLTSSNQYTRN